LYRLFIPGSLSRGKSGYPLIFLDKVKLFKDVYPYNNIDGV